MYANFIFTFKLDNDRSSVETSRIFPDNFYLNQCIIPVIIKYIRLRFWSSTYFIYDLSTKINFRGKGILIM